MLAGTDLLPSHSSLEQAHLTMAIPGRGRAPGTRGRSPRLASSCSSSTSLDDDEVVILGGAAWEDLEDWWLAVSREIQVRR